ncbi:MAG: hypothetical protein QXX36_01965 [Candidatus Rehaiarchaeum fermentans]|nr:hypothetical protein [Candidatus Rehaiarchaeum fermentans]MCW1292364.1 hypothetical protein [Candidatus Rehaiarchaeum fermentans]MCW1297304.1 hypothetical protein [Candidatus Rehaiarchaeum fermentans]MCW1302371.1 hypothetical protein [Candidatus Rehaiarchaeum fermentans]
MKFIILLRKGYTKPFSTNLRNAGRLDVLHQVAISTFFISKGIRRNNSLDAFLYGPGDPPLHMQIDGKSLYDVRTDEETWKDIINNILSGKTHPGISIKKEGIESYLKNLKERIFVLREDGENIQNYEIKENDIFLLGDHIGLPIKLENYAIKRGAIKLSIGKVPYLAYQVVTIINYIFDKNGASRNS